MDVANEPLDHAGASLLASLPPPDPPPSLPLSVPPPQRGRSPHAPPPLPPHAALEEDLAAVGAPVVARAVVSSPEGAVDLELGSACFAGVVIGRPAVVVGEVVPLRMLLRFDGGRALALDPPVVYVARVVEIDEVDEDDEDDEDVQRDGCDDVDAGAAALRPGAGFAVKVELDAALELLTAPAVDVVDDADIVALDDAAQRGELAERGPG